MSLFLDTKKSSYRAIRQASQGASVSLTRNCTEYVATFNCATSIASVRGERGLTMEEGIPTYRIPIEEMEFTCRQLMHKFSIALVECAVADDGIAFVLLWKIPVVHPETPVADVGPSSLNLDDY